LGIVVAGIDHDDAARHVRKQPPRKLGDGLLWDRDDDDFSGFGGGDNGNGRRADLSRQRGQALRSSRVRNRDVMAELGEVARKCPSNVSSTDDSDSHVDYSFQIFMLQLWVQALNGGPKHSGVVRPNPRKFRQTGFQTSTVWCSPRLLI